MIAAMPQRVLLSSLTPGSTFRTADSPYQSGIVLNHMQGSSKIRWRKTWDGKGEGTTDYISLATEVVATGYEDPSATKTPAVVAKRGSGLVVDTADENAEKPKLGNVRDYLGSRLGTTCSAINHTFGKTPITPDEIAKIVPEAKMSLIKAHIKTLSGKTRIVASGDGWVLADGIVHPDAGGAAVIPGPKRPVTARYQIFGMSAASVLRAMGALGWDYEKCAVATDTLAGHGMSEVTIRMCIAAGKRGDDQYGPIPELTKKQIAELEAASK